MFEFDVAGDVEVACGVRCRAAAEDTTVSATSYHLRSELGLRAFCKHARDLEALSGTACHATVTQHVLGFTSHAPPCDDALRARSIS